MKNWNVRARIENWNDDVKEGLSGKRILKISKRQAEVYRLCKTGMNEGE